MAKRSTTSAAKKLAAFLEESELKVRMQKCSVCSNELVRELVSLHLDKLFDGETTIGLKYLHDNLLQAQGGPKSYEAVKRHVKQCLGREVTSGQVIES